MEAVFELELGSWILPKYIPLNPIVLNERSLEEYKMNLIGTCKIISRCKIALVRLINCSAMFIDKSDINIRNIVYRVNNWFSGLSNFLNDLIKTFDSNEDLKELIKHSTIAVDKWTNKIYPEWISKWEIIDETNEPNETNETNKTNETNEPNETNEMNVVIDKPKELKELKELKKPKKSKEPKELKEPKKPKKSKEPKKLKEFKKPKKNTKVNDIDNYTDDDSN